MLELENILTQMRPQRQLREGTWQKPLRCRLGLHKWVYTVNSLGALLRSHRHCSICVKGYIK